MGANVPTLIVLGAATMDKDNRHAVKNKKNHIKRCLLERYIFNLLEFQGNTSHCDPAANGHTFASDDWKGNTQAIDLD